MRLRRALDEFVIDGIETTIPLFRDLVADPDIQAGDYDIHWLEKIAGAARGRGRLTGACRAPRATRATIEITPEAAAAGLCLRHLPDGRVRPTIRASTGSSRSRAASCRSTASTCRGGSRARCAPSRFEIRIDRDFDGGDRRLRRAAPGPARKTWINERIRRLYGELFRLGHVPHGRGLAGRPAGRRPLRRALGAAFFGESMFTPRARCLEGGAGPPRGAAAARAASACSTPSSSPST